jgi:DNA polymerase I
LSYIASKIFPEFNNLSLKEIKKNHKEERQIAKISGFTLNYGGTAYTMYSKQGIPLKKAEYVEKAYFEAFPGLKKYYDTCEQETLKNGYITVDNILGSKFYIAGFDKFKDLHNQYINKQLSREDISYYYRWKGSLRRNSLNYPIQGTSANITKIACIHLFDWILDNNLQNIIKIVNIVHDEVLLECPKNIATEVAKKLKEFMEKAGRLYCTIVPLKADPEISTFWNH